MLDKILKQVKVNLERRSSFRPVFNNIKPSERDFKGALKGKEHLSLLAEVKQASPLHGVLRENFHHLELAETYFKAGADCVSVLTEESFFHGSHQFLFDISQTIPLPLLCKDFVIDSYQILEARFYCADAILLIVNILSFQQIQEFIKIAAALNMDVLLEVHSREELDIALRAYQENVLIGINNRNLETMEIDLNTAVALAPLVPKDVVTVAESGYQTAADLKTITGLADAVLIGSSLVRDGNPMEKIKSMFLT